MKITNEIRVVGGVLGMLLVLLAFLMYENTSELRVQNSYEEEKTQYRETQIRNDMQQEYDRLVLECAEPALQESTDQWLRDLCDETLPALRTELYGVGR